MIFLRVIVISVIVAESREVCALRSVLVMINYKFVEPLPVSAFYPCV